MAKLTVSEMTIRAASLGRENPLPDLGSTGDAHARIAVDYETVTPEEARYMGWGRVHTILPYTLQDGYDRHREPRRLKTIELENAHIRAVFLPTLGGRLWSLTDKDRGQELLHRNPVFQPANLALRNAWFSGGVEWNCGIIGHTPYTCDDMCCEALTLSDGTPVLRMYQYERVRRLLYRVEAFLPEDARELYVRVRIDNTLPEETAVYWWSNMAVNEGEDIRVVVPAEKAFRYGYGGKLSKIPVPYMTAEADKLRGQAARLARENGGTLDWDITRSLTLPQSMDFFFDIPDGTRPFLAALNREGYGICQTSTGELRGRKLFVWGNGQGGRHWQTFLSEPGSAYIELQAGLAHTQLEHLPMAGHATISWLESYGPLQADGNAVQGADWSAAVGSAARALDAQRPAQVLEAYHQRVREELDSVPAGNVLHRGDAFGMLDSALYGDAFSSAGLDMAAMRTGEKTEPWERLLAEGVLPCPDPMAAPLSYQTGKAWEDKVTASLLQTGGDHWFAWYHRGVMAHARDDRGTAQAAYEASLARSENPWALRCLALLSKAEGDREKAAEQMLRAARMQPIRPLVIEAMEALMEVGQFTEMLAFYQTLPERLQKEDGRVRTYYAAALLRTGALSEAEAVLQGDIVLTDVREGNTLLTDLWFEIAALRHFGRADAESLAWAEAHTPVPEHLDFRML